MGADGVERRRWLQNWAVDVIYQWSWWWRCSFHLRLTRLGKPVIVRPSLRRTLGPPSSDLLLPGAACKSGSKSFRAPAALELLARRGPLSAPQRRTGHEQSSAPSHRGPHFSEEAGQQRKVQ